MKKQLLSKALGTALVGALSACVAQTAHAQQTNYANGVILGN